MRTYLVLCGVVGVLAGCNSGDEAKLTDPKCPQRAVQVALENQTFLSHEVVVGETSSKILKSRKGVYRKAVLEREGQTRDAVFLVTGVQGCKWLPGSSLLTPVVVQDGVIVATGSQALRDMTAQGWKIREAVWPWQNYDFGYLPKK